MSEQTLPPSGRLRRPPWVLVAAVALVVAVIAALVVAIVVVLDADDEDGGDAALGELVAASQVLVHAVQDESNVTSTGIMGLGEALDQPAAGSAEAQQATDTALADYLATAGAQDGTVEAQVEGVRDALSDLDPLRQEVDGRQGPADLSAAPYAQEVFDRYGGILDALLSATTEVITTQADGSEARHGAELLELGWQQRQATTGLLLGTLMTPSPGTVDSSEAITDLATASDELQRGRFTLAELATRTPYEDAATQLEADLEDAGLTAAADDALASGTLDVAALLDAVTASTAAWEAFLDRVEATMTGSADRS
jgi:hypothetical protein